jgi:hypothetical protein
LFAKTMGTVALAFGLIGLGGAAASATLSIAQLNASSHTLAMQDIDWSKVGGSYNSSNECQHALSGHPAGSYCAPHSGAWVVVLP